MYFCISKAGDRGDAEAWKEGDAQRALEEQRGEVLGFGGGGSGRAEGAGKERDVETGKDKGLEPK